jgi:hypothetical protein
MSEISAIKNTNQEAYNEMVANEETGLILAYLTLHDCDYICKYEQCPKYYGWFSGDWVLNLILNS